MVPRSLNCSGVFERDRSVDVIVGKPRVSVPINIFLSSILSSASFLLQPTPSENIQKRSFAHRKLYGGRFGSPVNRSHRSTARLSTAFPHHDRSAIAKKETTSIRDCTRCFGSFETRPPRIAFLFDSRVLTLPLHLDNTGILRSF